MTAAVMRVGWCPGALRPMATGDGLIVRVKPRGATLALDQASAIASLAQRYGNGDLDLTARANLQVRGVREDTLEPLLDGLRAVGLLDDTPEAEAVRNIVASPLAGIDPDAVCDIRPIVAALELRLGTDPVLSHLPAKWSMVVDDGGRFPLTGIHADIRFEAAPGGSFLVGVADHPTRAFCQAESVAGVAAALCRLGSTSQPTRMAEAVARRGAPAVFAAADLVPVQTAETATPHPRPPNPIGPHPLSDQLALGIGAPFGRLEANDLAALIASARAFGASDVRLTPWRAVLLTGLDPASAAALAEMARELLFIVDRDDPRLAIAACTGAPACHRATTPVRRHAAALTAGMPARSSGIVVHVSGCAKGCAHPAAAPWTLVGREGRYDVVRGGRPGDAPLVQGLSFQEAASWLSRNRNPGRP